MSLLSMFAPRKTFPHGIHPVEHKEQTANKPIRRLAFAPELVIPLAQHKGRPAVPIVKVGQEVVRGEPIAEADGFLSVPMHAPATGVIRAIDLAPTAEGPKARAIYLKVYEAATQEVLYDMPRDLSALGTGRHHRRGPGGGPGGAGGRGLPQPRQDAPRPRVE